jgi:hypothetical protein
MTWLFNDVRKELGDENENLSKTQKLSIVTLIQAQD